MEFTALASGSSGNCICISSGNTTLLSDAGISCRRIENSLKAIGLTLNDLTGILITHEHSDHINGLRVLSKKAGVPIYGTAETLDMIKKIDGKHEIDDSVYNPIEKDIVFNIGDMMITAFENTHDAVCPVGYRVSDGKSDVVICTDLGNYSEYTVEKLEEADILYIESNHDIHMLEAGPYPYMLKRRILSDYGHLSNELCGRLISRILHDNVKEIVLGHLSKENNLEELALRSVMYEIDLAENGYKASDFKITVAKRDVISDTIVV